MPPPNSPELVPAHVVVDPDVRRSAGGRTLIGGSPLRILRLTEGGARLVDRIAAGEAVPRGSGAHRLVRRLLDTGMVHPAHAVGADRTHGGAPGAPRSCAVVVPVRDDAEGLVRTLAAVCPEPEVRHVVVVDDGSDDPAAVAAAVDAAVAHIAGTGLEGGARVDLERHVVAAGPGAARDTGWRASAEDVVVFCDADVVPAPGSLGLLLAHLADPCVAAAAPRIHAEGGGASALDRYEVTRTPLDLGARPARVAPRTRVSYVPTALLAVRRSAMEDVGGFDPGLRYGEDVDLVWRLVEHGWTVRYEPSAAAGHRNRRSWVAMARQRFSYGSAAAPLDRRHPGAVAPLELHAWSAATWACLALGGRRLRLLGALAAVGSTVELMRRFRGRLDEPVREGLRLAGLGHVWAGRWSAVAARRAWLPLLLVAAPVSRRARRVLAVVLLVPPVVEWVTERPGLDPARWVAARALDDAAYCAGVWAGCRNEGSWNALRPRIEMGSVPAT